MTWYRNCAGCSTNLYHVARESKLCASAMVILSSVGQPGKRVQKNSGSFALCPDCLKKLVDGRMPKTLREGLKNAYTALGGKA